jgi:hypothetical protein
MNRAFSTNGKKRNACRLLVGRLETKIPLERLTYRLVGNIKLDVGEIEWGGIDWIDLTQDKDQWKALVNMVINLLVP